MTLAELVNDRVLQSRQVVCVDAGGSRSRKIEAVKESAARSPNVTRGSIADTGNVRSIVVMPIETEINPALESVCSFDGRQVVDELKSSHAASVVGEVCVRRCRR